MAYTLSERQFPINAGPLDRAIRIVLGLVLLALAIVGPESLWGLVGIAPLLTGLSGYSPLYAMLDVRTGHTPHRAERA